MPVIRMVARQAGDYPRVRGPVAGCVHPFHVLSCHLGGTGRYRLGDEVVEARAPFLLLLARGERDANAMSGRMDYRAIGFDDDAIRRRRDGSVSIAVGGEVATRGHLRPLAPDEAARAVTLFDELAAHARRPEPAAQARATARFYELVALWAEPPRAAGDGSAVRRYRALIEQHADRADLSLEALAGRIGMSATHLSVLFRRAYAATPVAYRLRVRLWRARNLLATTPLPVAEVAAAVGFADATYFARAFRRAFSVSPRAFARRAASLGGEPAEA